MIKCVILCLLILGNCISFQPCISLKGRKQKSLKLFSTIPESKQGRIPNSLELDVPNIVLVAGFESFNKKLYRQAASNLKHVNLSVFADNEIHSTPKEVNPQFTKAMEDADIFIGSLIFDYDDALAVESLLEHVKGPKLFFECSSELMVHNQLGTFSMNPKDGKEAGPPKAIKALISSFSSGNEEDKISSYLKLLKIGPSLLKLVPGEKAQDLRTWLQTYKYWNAGGSKNIEYMVDLLTKYYLHQELKNLPEALTPPDIGLIHPLHEEYFQTPSEYLSWRLSQKCMDSANIKGMSLANNDAPCTALLLYRKHVITEQNYIMDIITQMEKNGVIPVPIFINGVEAHTIVRDWLTTSHEIKEVTKGHLTRAPTYDNSAAIEVDSIVSTIGFPLVGGPAGSVKAGRNVAVAERLLTSMNVPYLIASPLLLQSLEQWKKNGVLGLQSVVMYSLPELDGAIDTVVLGGLIGDDIELVDERVEKLCSRIKGWNLLRKTPNKDKRIAIILYGFPPNVGAVGTAALLDVPKSLENILRRLYNDGYNVGDFATDPNACGESLVAALSVLSEESVIAMGAAKMEGVLQNRIQQAENGDKTMPDTLAKRNGGLGGAKVRAMDLTFDDLEKVLGKYMSEKIRRSWKEKDRSPGLSRTGDMVICGLEIGNIFVAVQPQLGLEGDPMRLLFERDLTPHPQYAAFYKFLSLPQHKGGIGANSFIHLGMHGTEEWLPGQNLGNDRESWSDELMDGTPNLYAYAANNPSESILAKRRGYGTLISYNVPPYGRAGLYLELANLRELLTEYRNSKSVDLRQPIWSNCLKAGIDTEVPLYINDEPFTDFDLPQDIHARIFNEWMVNVGNYLDILQDRLFSSGLHVLGEIPSESDMKSYLQAYFNNSLSDDECNEILVETSSEDLDLDENLLQKIFHFTQKHIHMFSNNQKGSEHTSTTIKSKMEEAKRIVSLLSKNTDEIDNILVGLSGGFIPPKPGGDLLRDGTSVLPTGRNIHALDPYRMPSEGAWIRGQKIVEETIKQHLEQNEGAFPETIACTLWGLDSIKSKGDSIAIVLSLVGARPVKEGTGRVVRFDPIPLSELNRPRIDCLATLSGIFRDSFGNVVDMLDDMFERLAEADEPVDMNFIKKHALELKTDGVERPAARLFSNPPGDYGSMVNEVVNTGDWEDSKALGDTWEKRNMFSYGRNENNGNGISGTARPQVLTKLLSTTERIVQEIDSVEYGLTDINEYYANTGALKTAAENKKSEGHGKKVSVSIVEAFNNAPNPSDQNIPVRELEDVLRLEYRSKLLNPKWRDAMVDQGSGGAYEVSQRMTAMIGWGATAKIDKFVFDQAAERYALDEAVARKLQQNNPEAFKNVVRRLLEANGRGMWETDEDTLKKLRDLYSDADDMIEQLDSLYN